MCGIAGIVSLNEKLKVSFDDLKPLLLSLKHRGPDGEGVSLSANICIGMKRLSIIDVEGGKQPLVNEDNTIEIVGNGEIYNYIEIQKELKTRGHRLKTGSDIEVPVHLYEDFALNFVNHLRGMFALALYDKKKEKLILARDRIGEKPLYYSITKDRLVFSSEMKSLLMVGGIDKTLSLESIDAYLHFYYVPEPYTVFSNIKKIPAGGMLIIDIKSKKVALKQYYNASDTLPEVEGDPSKVILKNLQEACKLTLRSDVPVGISLSGGLDSGSILALSAPYYKDRMKAFTVGYEGTPKTDERKLARALAKRFNVEHIEKEIKTKDFIDDFPRLIYNSDDPIADIAGYSIYSVAKLARENGIKVLLGGLGGDEIFWGYPWVGQSVEENSKSKDKHMIFYEKTRSFIDAERFIRLFLHSEFKSLVGSTSYLKYVDMRKPKSKLLLARKSMDLIRNIWLTSNCIALNDRLSMAASVELRSPLLDYKLMETAYKYKENVLGYEKGHKYWLKKALSGILPDEILNIPKKGFTPPVAPWLYSLLSKYSHLLNDGYLVQERILSKKAVKAFSLVWKLLPNYWYAYYQLLVLEVWLREYVWKESPEDIKGEN